MEEECEIYILVFTYGRGMGDRWVYPNMEEEYEIYISIHIWKWNARYMLVFTYGKVIPDRCI